MSQSFLALVASPGKRPAKPTIAIGSGLFILRRSRVPFTTDMLANGVTWRSSRGRIVLGYEIREVKSGDLIVNEKIQWKMWLRCPLSM